MNKHEKFIKDLGFDEFSNLGDYLEFLRNGQEDVDRWNREDEEGESFNEGYEEGFQKGKLEQKKEELKFLLIMKEHIETNNCPLPTLRLNDIIEQLQKEIGGMKE